MSVVNVVSCTYCNMHRAVQVDDARLGAQLGAQERAMPWPCGLAAFPLAFRLGPAGRLGQVASEGGHFTQDQNWGDFGRIWPNFGQVWAELGQHFLALAKIVPTSSNLGLS